MGEGVETRRKAGKKGEVREGFCFGRWGMGEADGGWGGSGKLKRGNEKGSSEEETG